MKLTTEQIEYVIIMSTPLILNGELQVELTDHMVNSMEGNLGERSRTDLSSSETVC
jgi:hypothetical protein